MERDGEDGMKVSKKRLKSKLAEHNVPTRYYKDWDSTRIDPYNGRSDFRGIVLHHTAGVNSERYIAETNPYAPVRACHFLITRSGEVVVMSGSGAYHAGSGGPYKFPSGIGKEIPKDEGNKFLYGIEIESMGTSASINNKKEGMTRKQVVATALLCAALLNAMKTSPGYLPVSRVIRHKDWTPRKVDVLQDLEWWHQVIGVARRNKDDVEKTTTEINAFIDKHKNGQF